MPTSDEKWQIIEATGMVLLSWLFFFAFGFAVGSVVWVTQ